MAEIGRFVGLGLRTSDQAYSVRKLTPSGDTWARLRKPVLRMQRAAFANGGLEREVLENDFCNANNALVVLFDAEDRPIGFSFAEPVEQVLPDWQNVGRKTAYVSLTVIDAQHRGQGLVWGMLEKLDRELKKRGFTQVVRDAACYNGYADRLEVFYGDRVQNPNEPDHESEYGPQRRLLISL